jgi:hypothetical protein
MLTPSFLQTDLCSRSCERRAGAAAQLYCIAICERGLPLNVKPSVGAVGWCCGCHLRRVVPYARGSGASPSLLIVARVSSIVHSGIATHSTLDTNIGHEHATRSHARLKLRSKIASTIL